MRYEEAERDLKQHYEATGTRELSEYTYRVAHLTGFFAGRRIATIGQPDVDRYIVRRQEAHAQGSTMSWVPSGRCCAWPTRTES